MTDITVIQANNSTVSSGTVIWGDGSSLVINSPATVLAGATLHLNISKLSDLSGPSDITVLPGGSVLINGRTITVSQGSILKIRPR